MAAPFPGELTAQACQAAAATALGSYLPTAQPPWRLEAFTRWNTAPFFLFLLPPFQNEGISHEMGERQ